MKEFSSTHKVPNPKQPGCDKRGPLVLLVEDEEEPKNFMKDILMRENIGCITAGSVGEALNELRREKVTVLVLDWGLDRSGSEVLNIAKEEYPWIPVIVMSGLPFDVRTDAAVHQADAFLQKPFSATVLIGQVRQAIDRVKNFPVIPLPRRAEEVLPLEAVKKLYIRHVVELLDGSVVRAAAALELHRQTVSAALKQDVTATQEVLAQ